MTLTQKGTRQVLYLDIEGGYGGSSHSLFQLVSHLDRTRFSPLVWFRSEGPAQARLDGIQVVSAHRPDIVHITPIQRNNWKNFLVVSPRLPRLISLIRSIRRTNPDILHLNHVGLTPLATLLRLSGWQGRIVIHDRSQLPPNAFSRAYCSMLNRVADHVIFITENELALADANGFDVSSGRHSVIYNPAPRSIFDIPPRALSGQPTLRLVFLGTLSTLKAPDRLIETARHLKANGIRARIDAFGAAPRQVGKRTALDDLRSTVQQEGLQEIISFHGHTNDPYNALQNADLLIRPSRANDPWGRDVIEAMAAGVPVLAAGAYDRFVENGETGILLPEWDSAEAAARIASLANSPRQMAQLRDQARTRASKLFAPENHAARVMAIYDAIP